MNHTEMTDFAQILDEMQAKENNGRGISCVQTVIIYLRLGALEKAKAVCQNEHDKIINYPEIMNLLIEKLYLNGEEHPWWFFVHGRFYYEMQKDRVVRGIEFTWVSGIPLDTDDHWVCSFGRPVMVFPPCEEHLEWLIYAPLERQKIFLFDGNKAEDGAFMAASQLAQK